MQSSKQSAWMQQRWVDMMHNQIKTHKLKVAYDELIKHNNAKLNQSKWDELEWIGVKLKSWGQA